MDTRSLSLFNTGAFFTFAFAIPDSPFPQLLAEVMHHMGIRPVVCQKE
jgi:H+/gluconate symporter-like permease